MKKRNKRVNENGEELENFFDVFMRNYRNVKGFRSFVKLCLYFLIIFLFILFINLADKELSSKREANTYRTTTIQKKKKVYKEILEEIIIQKKDVFASLKIGDNVYHVDFVMKDEISGFIETANETKRFKIRDGKVFEIKLNQEIENEQLFEGIKLDFLLPEIFIRRLESQISTKMIYDQYTIYTYKIEQEGKEYKVDCTVENDILTKVKIVGEEEEYEILYE